VVQTAAVHGYTTAFDVSALLIALSVVAVTVFIGPKASHVLAGQGADPMVREFEPAMAS
jgi:hypothetical protein